MDGKTAETIATYIGDDSWTPKDTIERHPSHEAIADLAYYLFEARGRKDGRDLDDWLCAEHLLAHGRVVSR